MKKTKNYYKILTTSDTAFTVFVTVFFLAMFIETYAIEETSSGLLPRLLCTLGFIFGSTILLLKFIKPADESKDKDSKNVIHKDYGMHVVITVIYTAVYFLVMPFLGFILTNVIGMVAFSFFMGFKRKMISLLVAISVTVTLYLVFGYFLKVRLPQGIIEALLPF